MLVKRGGVLARKVLRATETPRVRLQSITRRFQCHDDSGGARQRTSRSVSGHSDRIVTALTFAYWPAAAVRSSRHVVPVPVEMAVLPGQVAAWRAASAAGQRASAADCAAEADRSAACEDAASLLASGYVPDAASSERRRFAAVAVRKAEPLPARRLAVTGTDSACLGRSTPGCSSIRSGRTGSDTSCRAALPADALPESAKPSSRRTGTACRNRVVVSLVVLAGSGRKRLTVAGRLAWHRSARGRHGQTRPSRIA